MIISKHGEYLPCTFGVFKLFFLLLFLPCQLTIVVPFAEMFHLRRIFLDLFTFICQEEECARLSQAKRKLQRELDDASEQCDSVQHELASYRQRARASSYSRTRGSSLLRRDLDETDSPPTSSHEDS